jgi:hypothetical protein
MVRGSVVLFKLRGGHVHPTEKEIVEAAVRWWITKRPVGFNEEEHLIRPAIRIATPAERELCYAVAHHIKAVAARVREQIEEKVAR